MELFALKLSKVRQARIKPRLHQIHLSIVGLRLRTHWMNEWPNEWTPLTENRAKQNPFCGYAFNPMMVSLWLRFKRSFGKFHPPPLSASYNFNGFFWYSIKNCHFKGLEQCISWQSALNFHLDILKLTLLGYPRNQFQLKINGPSEVVGTDVWLNVSVLFILTNWLMNPCTLENCVGGSSAIMVSEGGGGKELPLIIF